MNRSLVIWKGFKGSINLAILNLINFLHNFNCYLFFLFYYIKFYYKLFYQNKTLKNDTKNYFKKSNGNNINKKTLECIYKLMRYFYVLIFFIFYISLCKYLLNYDL